VSFDDDGSLMGTGASKKKGKKKKKKGKKPGDAGGESGSMMMNMFDSGVAHGGHMNEEEGNTY
jgi:hypothetical protein